MAAIADMQILDFRTADEWEAWLEQNADESDGVRLRIAKKHADGLHIAEALDVALCFGWIDGRRNAHDDDSFLQAYGPRRSRSPWSQINRDHVERLAAAGRMRPRGFAEIERAKADGRWAAAYRIKDAPVPDDLRAALDASAAASAAFDRLSGQNRFAILFRIGEAKRPETRARRIAVFVTDLENGTTPYPQASRE